MNCVSGKTYVKTNLIELLYCRCWNVLFLGEAGQALLLTAVDISGRSFLCFDAEIPTEKVGDFDTELVQEFFEAFTRHAGVTLHIRKLSGCNSHHIIEGVFKSFARTMKQAVSIDEKNRDRIPSTKGVLS